MKVFRKVACALFVVTLSFSSCVQGDLYDDFYDEDMPSWMMIGRRKFKNDNGDQSNSGSSGSGQNSDPDPYDELHPDGYVNPWEDIDDDGQSDDDTHHDPYTPRVHNSIDDTPVIIIPDCNLGNWERWKNYMPNANTIRTYIESVMVDAWNETLNYCDESKWGELAFWIYYNPYTMRFSTSKEYEGAGKYFEGDKKPYGQQVEAKISRYGVNQPIEDNDKGFVCGWCHTHPRVERYNGQITRTKVGPSDKDIELAYSWGLPGFVVDYASTCGTTWGSKKMNITAFGPNYREK